MGKYNDINKAFEILSTYEGKNPYMLMLKRDVYVDKKTNAIGAFQVEFILKNHDYQPKMINKVIPIADWYGEKRREVWQLDFTPTKLKIISIFGETDSAYACYVQYRQSVEPVMCFIPKRAALANFLVDDYTQLQLDFSWFDKKLKAINQDWYVMNHQKEAVKFLLTRKKCILAADMGTGKSMTSIIASLMYGNKKVLVICPASLKTNWSNELERFVSKENIRIIKGFNEMTKNELLDFLKIEDENKYNVSELRDMAKANGKWNEGKQFTILNFDIIDEFHTNTRKNENSTLLKGDFDIVIIDEAHKLSNNTSNRFKVIKNYLKKAKNEYTWLLTGTMFTNNVKNLYNLISLIENDITGDYQYFMSRYCDAKKILMKGEWERCWRMWNKAGYSSYQVMNNQNKAAFRDFVERVGKHVMLNNGATNLDELNNRISHLYYRITKESMMNVEKIIVPVEYHLTDIQKKEYDKLWDEYQQEKMAVDNKDLSDMKNLLSVGVYRQYLSKQMVPNTIELSEKLLSKNKKVFIVCCYDEELYALKEYFGDKAVIYNGKMNQKQKDKSVADFNDNPSITVFIGNIKACGVGINLNKSCNHAIFQNLDFTDAAFSQACDRIFRIGSNDNAYIYLQYFKDTVYERVVKIIETKKNIAEQVINDNN